MRAKLISILIAAVMAIALVSCGKSNNADADKLWNPEVSQRKVITSNGSMCGVLYMNYSYEEMSDMKKDRNYYQKIFEDSGSIKEFPFLKNIPDSQIISTPMGSELYLIIPGDMNAHVSIYQMELDEDAFTTHRREEPLYSSDAGAPVVLQCNYGDLLSDAEIVITDSSGEELVWSPFISLRDGTVHNKTDDGKIIYDFTEYEFSDEMIDD